jgi:hypothetical protein
MKRFLLCLMLATPAFGDDQFAATDANKLTDAQVLTYTGNKPQPPALKDATIQVQLKDGETKYDFSANTHKVVSRESSRRVQALIDRLRKLLADCEGKLAASVSCSDKLSELEKKLGDSTAENERLREQVAELEKTQQKPNRITFHAGVGPDGVLAEKNADGQLVKAAQAPIVGVGYQRIVYDQFSVGLTAFGGVSSKSKTFTGALNIGYDF